MSPRPVRTLRRRIRRSGLYRDLHEDRHFIAACLLILVFAAGLALMTRGLVVTPEGVYRVPTELPSCGDYCGTDAGLITTPAP